MNLKKFIKEFAAYLGNEESVLDSRYKHVSQKIYLLWGSEQFYLYMGKLIIQDRDADRQGFSPEAMQELFVLSDIHDRLFPDKRPHSFN